MPGRIHFLLLSSCLFLSYSGFSEGIRQLMPDSNVSAAGLYIYNSGTAYTNFAKVNCAPNYRLNIHVQNAGETILFGLESPYSGVTYNLRKPDGTIVMTGTCPYAVGQTGYIRYYKQAVQGPFPLASGYSPLSYRIINAADTGDYYFEFSFPYSDMTINLWDFQVVTGSHIPALPADTLNGRVWSSSWQLYADLGNVVFQPFNGKFFVYSDDGIVTKLAFSNAHVGAVTIFCNPWGCFNTGNFINDRRSVNLNTYTTFPAIARYKVFLNDPDITVYPNGAYGQITGSPYMIEDPAFPPCSPQKQIVVNVNKSGTLEVTISLPYGAPATTVDFYVPVTAGTNTIPWNGLDGQGNQVPDLTMVTVTLNYVNGLTNLPIWDQERNPDGYVISLIRPAGSSTMVPDTYWDDSQLVISGLCPVAPQSVNLSGCTPGSMPGYPGCHPWGYNQADCHDKMINTWWYSSTSSALFTAVFHTGIPNAVGIDSSRCGPGEVLLRAIVQPGGTADWYDSINGGTLLLSGNTSFLTPYLYATKTYYAEARDTSGVCYSPSRTPVVATIKPVVFPQVSGPAYVCENSGLHNYITQSGMLNYHWVVSPGGLIISGQGTSSVFINWIALGNNTVSVTFTNQNGCVPGLPGTMDVNATGIPGPAGPITGPSPLCTGIYGVRYSIAPVPGAENYIWSIPPGVLVETGLGSNAIIVDIPPGTSSGTFSVYTENGCGPGSPSPPFLLTVNQPVTVNAGQGDTLCEGSPFTVKGASAVNYSSLHWSASGQGTFSDAGVLDPVYYPAAGDTGLVRLILLAHGISPCHDDSSELTLVYNVKPSVDAGNNGLVCGGASYLLSTSSAVNFKELVWTSSGNGTFSDSHVLHPVYSPSADDILNGQVALVLGASPLAPCEASQDSMLLTMAKGPSAWAGKGGVVCGGSPFTVNNATASNYSHIQWTSNGRGVLTGDTSIIPTYTPADDESGTVVLTMNVNGVIPCNDSVVQSRVSITVYTGVTADAGPEQLIPDNTSTTLAGSVQGGSGDFSFSWEPSSLLINPSVINPETKILTTDTVFVLRISDNKTICSGTDRVRVRVKKSPPPPPPPPTEDCIIVHNVITPNGDGLNDKFIIECIENFPDNSVQIFTRWGDVIRKFERYDNKSEVWDGTNGKGEPMPDGTYYYILNIKNQASHTGWVFVRDSSK
ncbi:MAG: gliding motility-associated C-terminal domain-containing protein [Bacteroidota bacterium]|jgi:gliding motility-associated-like protein